MRYSSGQRGQTVNLLTMSSKVRILLSPPLNAGVAQLARALAFQAGGRGFESRLPLHDFRCNWELLNFFCDTALQNKFSRLTLTIINEIKLLLLAGMISVYPVVVGSYGSGVEHFLGKEEVEGSSPSMSSIHLKSFQ